MKSGGRDEYLDSFLIEAISAALPVEWDVECIIFITFFVFLIVYTPGSKDPRSQKLTKS